MEVLFLYQRKFKKLRGGEQDFYWLPEVFAGYQLFLNSWSPGYEYLRFKLLKQFWKPIKIFVEVKIFFLPVKTNLCVRCFKNIKEQKFRKKSRESGIEWWRIRAFYVNAIIYYPEMSLITFHAVPTHTFALCEWWR